MEGHMNESGVMRGMTPLLYKTDDPYRLQSLDRALAVLQTLEENDLPLSLSNLCQIMQIHKSTAHRLLMALERSSLIERTRDNRFYLGMKLYELGHRAIEQTDLRSRVGPHLQRLAARLQETVHLGIMQRNRIVYLDKLDPHRRVCMASKIGTHNPIHCTALGKAILAYLPEEILDATLSKLQFVRYTSKTLLSKEELVRSLERVRRRGYAIDDEEIEAGVRCIGAPVFDENNFPIAAISVSDLSVRIRVQNLHGIAVHLMNCATDISASIGGDPQKKLRVMPMPVEERAKVASHCG